MINLDKRGRESGFTLIELMVVVLILAVLIGVSIPLYQGIRARGQDAKAHSALTAGARIEGALSSIDGEFTDDIGRLAVEEPALDWSGGSPEALHVVVDEVVVGSGLNEQLLLYARSQSGRWFGIRLVSTGADAGRHTCMGDTEADVSDIATCVGSNW